MIKETLPQKELRLRTFVGRRLYTLRECAGYSQARLGKVVDVSPSQIQEWENGNSCLPAERLFLIAEHFGVPLSFFFCSSPAGVLKHRSYVPEEVFDAVDALLASFEGQK